MTRSYDLRAAHVGGLERALVADGLIRTAAHDLIGGTLNLGFADLPTPAFDTSDLGDSFWNSFPENHGNTFALYLCGLRPAYLLGAGGFATRDPAYLRLADSFVRSFAEHAEGPRPADMAFNDHATAERVENLTLLLRAADELNVDLESYELIFDIVRRDTLLLVDGDLYQSWHNHGIIADRAVLLAAILLQDEDGARWTERAIERLRLQVGHAFGADGVHCENSFDYHLLVTTVLADCVDILRLIGDPYATELELVLDGACEFIAHALKPSGRTPLFGDSKGSPEGTRRIDGYRAALPDSAGLVRYVLSKGLDGNRPEKTVRHFPSGYAFIRSTFEPEGFDDATWISLRAGYSTRVHKQRDDLSIGLYSKGHDIFVDSGMTDYMPHDPVTRHMASVAAHTTTGVEGSEQPLAAGLGRKFRIIACRRHESWDYVAASNHAIAGVAIYRHLYYLRESDVLIIHDEFISDDPHTYLQYFKLSPDVSLVSPDHEGVQLAIGTSGSVADVLQLASYDSLQLSTGKGGSPMSVVSTGFARVRSTQTLTYRTTGSTVDLITAIRIRRASDEPLPVELQDKSVTVGTQVVPLIRSSPPRFYGSKVSTVGNEIHLTNEPGPGAENFAVYAHALSDGAILSRRDYTSAETLVVENPERVDCALVYFVRNSQFDRAEGVLAVCRYKADGVELRSYADLHKPMVHEISSRAVPESEGAFEFVIDLRYDLPARCRWWVYRNGANIHHEAAGGPVARFDFDRPGTYVVMCSVVDPLFGESWFGQFDPITV